MIPFILLTALISFCSCHDPDINRNVTELIWSQGFEASDHDVVTKDGYILTIQHIISPIKPKAKPKVVLLQHGLIAASHDWVLNFRNNSLGFILADAGYDVWLGNVRGNTYAERHVNMSSDSNEFWKFTFDEMAKYDLPAMIDYVLQQTGQSSLTYVGHSQGTLIAFALLSERLEYNKKVNLFVGLGPVIYVKHMTSPIRYLAPFSEDFMFFFRLFGMKRFLPSDTIMDILARLCPYHMPFQLCQNVYFLVNGIDPKQLNTTREPVYFSHDPAGTSTYNMLHWAQMIRSGKFQKFDFGEDENKARYNQTSPPEYNVTKIQTPVVLMWGLNDVLADPVDVALLAQQLSSLKLSYQVKYPEWGHVDFIFGLQARSLVYKPLLSFLNKYRKPLLSRYTLLPQM